MTTAGGAPRTGPRETPRHARDMLRMAREFLERKGVSESRLEAEILTAHALGLDRLHLFMELDRPLAPEEIDRARDLLVRRGRREPVAYITGKREFYSRSFRVDERVLIPRPETELIVDRARELGRDLVAPRVLDLGTGSGCIAITLALDFAEADVTAVDVSAEAVALARENAETLGAELTLVVGDAFEELARLAHGAGRPFDLIVSNPPYIRPDEREALAPEVREHEPTLALFAPEGDPDLWVRRLCEEAPAALAAGGALLVELGADQAPRALELARADGLDARTHRDLAGIERVLEVRRRERSSGSAGG